MAEELAGRVAIVTGGANGLGRAIVDRFVEEGARVVIADIDAEAGKAASTELGSAVTFQPTDVADADDVQRAVDVAVEDLGALDIMVNNAGIGGSHQRFLDDDFEDFERTMAVNILGVMVGCQRAARRMVEQGGGTILNTTSIGGINAGPGVMAYRASKAAVIHLSKSIAIELARAGVRVNCIAPAHIPTGINTTFDQEAIVRALQPLQRLASPADVAEAALYLASDRAAQITGVVLPVDGGTTAGPPPRPVKDLLAKRTPPPTTKR